MGIRIHFYAGPLMAMVGVTDTLDQCKVFFNPEKREVYLYVHQGDGDYLWSENLSKGLTSVYDAAHEKFGAAEQSVSFPDAEETVLELTDEDEWKPEKEYRIDADGDGYLPPSDWKPGSDASEPSDEPC